MTDLNRKEKVALAIHKTVYTLFNFIVEHSVDNINWARFNTANDSKGNKKLYLLSSSYTFKELFNHETNTFSRTGVNYDDQFFGIVSVYDLIIQKLEVCEIYNDIGYLEFDGIVLRVEQQLSEKIENYKSNNPDNHIFTVPDFSAIVSDEYKATV